MTSAPRLPEFYRLKVSDWLNLAEETRIVEIIDGEIFMAPSPAIRHQSLARELMVCLYRHVEEEELGTVFFAPTGLKLEEDVVLEPDLLVVLNEHQDQIKEFYVEAADVVIEILSPGTAGRDVGVKRDHYERARIAEYWIVDPEAREIEVLSLDGDAYVTHGVFGEDETLRSTRLPGLSIELESLWRRVDP